MALGKRVGQILGRGRGEERRERPPLMGRGRFDVSVMAILKDEAPNMEEWLCHHMAIGVDHFFLYDNGSTDELHDVLKPYADHGVVTTIYFPMRGLQRDANNHVVRFFGDTTEWIAYVDIDEFLVPERDESIGDVLARFPEAEQVLVSRKEFCYSGNRTPVGGLVTESYREYSEHVPRMGTDEILAKPIIRPRGTARVGIHNAFTVHGRTVNTAGEPTSEEATVIEDPTYANLQMNHYFTKSWAEFQAKRTRATTSTHAFQLPDVPFDIPGIEDHVIDRWQPRTRALMEEMRTIARSPARYGSKLRMPGFPINDLFGQEATAIVSNEAAGLAEARKRRSFRGLPMPGVRGAHVRGEDHDYEPAPGRFLRSPHIEQEMAWLQAEITWSALEAEPPLEVSGGTLEARDVPTVRLDGRSGSLVIPVGGAPLRQHALAYVLRVDGAGPIGFELSAREAGGWRSAATYEAPGAGTYLGLVALDKKPRTIDAVRLSLDGTREVAVYDLALLTFG
ncbi:MAG: glycosyltransferase family 92 protein [Candidatus Limnocylindrales bacterium]